jgi:hypothetical protein
MIMNTVPLVLSFVVMMQIQGFGPKTRTTVREELVASIETEIATALKGWELTRRAIRTDYVIEHWKQTDRGTGPTAAEGSPNMAVDISSYKDEEAAKKVIGDGIKYVQAPPTGKLEGLGDEAWFTAPGVKSAPFLVVFRKGSVVVHVGAFGVDQNTVRGLCDAVVRGIEAQDKTGPKQ